VFFHVSFPRVLGVVAGMICVSTCGVGVVRRRFVPPALMMLGRFRVMMGGLRMML